MLATGRLRLTLRTLSTIVRAKQWRSLATDSTAAVAKDSQQLPALLLRDYQEECIQSVIASLNRGQKRLGISLATGAGKTVIFTQLLDRIAPTSPDANQTLILAHRRELVEQAARHCTHAYPEKTVEIEMGSMHASGVADITIASVQSITSGTRMAKFDPGRFKLVLVDEAHHIVAPGYMRALGHFGLADKEACQKPGTPALVGVSATLSRFDGLALGAAIDEIVYHKDYIDMIGDGWLSKVIITTVQSTADLSRVASSGPGKDFQQGDLSRAVNTEQVNEITVRTWLAKAADAGRKSTLVFCVDLQHVADLTDTFRKHGVDAQYVTGDTDKVERSNRLDAFKRGEFPVLINCGVFTEGTDMPSVDCVILARPTKSRNLLVQMIGRGMRLHEGKTNCHIIDMVSSLEAGIITTPTLFGLDPGELLSGASVEEMQELKDQREAERASMGSWSGLASSTTADVPIKSVNFTDYGSVFDLIADTSGERHIRALSKYAWVQVGKDRYVLSGPTGTYLRIERLESAGSNELGYPGSDDRKYGTSARARTNECQYRVVEVRALPAGLTKVPYAAPREVSRTAVFSDAVHGADNYASKIFPHPFIYRHKSWRKGSPTPGQLDFLNKVRGKTEKPLTEDDIDKGTASDMITKIKHGARGRYADVAANRRRKEKKDSLLERERIRKQREQIAVGPLDS